MIDSTELRTAILARMEALGWNRLRLSKESGVGAPSLNEYLAGGREIRSDKLLSVLSSLGFRVVGPKGRGKK